LSAARNIILRIVHEITHQKGEYLIEDFRTNTHQIDWLARKTIVEMINLLSLLRVLRDEGKVCILRILRVAGANKI
jgi:hypothetical protein